MSVVSRKRIDREYFKKNETQKHVWSDSDIKKIKECLGTLHFLIININDNVLIKSFFKLVQQNHITSMHFSSKFDDISTFLLFLQDYQSLTTLGLSLSFNNNTQFDAFRQALNQNQTIKTLNLNDVFIEKTCQEDFRLLIKENTSVQSISFSSKTFAHSQKELSLLFGALNENTTLTELDVHFDFHELESPLKFKTDRYTLLNLNHLTMSIHSVVSFLTATLSNTNLQKLTLDKFNICDGQICKVTPVDAVGSLLAKNTTLKSLEIHDTFISEDGLLEMANTLSKNSTLTSLILRKVTNSIYSFEPLCRALQYNTSLLSLDISENRISPETIDGLSHSLIQNTVLTHLKLNGLYPDNSKLFFYNLVHHNTTIHHFFTSVFDQRDFFYIMTMLTYPRKVSTPIQQNSELFKIKKNCDWETPIFTRNITLFELLFNSLRFSEIICIQV